MPSTYIKDFISDDSISLIRTTGAADRAVFGIQCAEHWKKHNTPALAAKWKAKALESLQSLEQAVAEMREEIEAL